MTDKTNASDRELLEMAAKAAELKVKTWDGHTGPMCAIDYIHHGRMWMPLIDDGDEARLEAALGFSVGWGKYVVQVDEIIETFAAHNGDKQAARRRAGVRAAAAIGAAK